VLQILKTTEEDLGLYVCEAQLNSIITETKAAGLIVEPWDMMEPLFHHLRRGNCSY
jgi:hypothetical protein